jgi:hypothetical protein
MRCCFSHWQNPVKSRHASGCELASSLLELTMTGWPAFSGQIIVLHACSRHKHRTIIHLIFLGLFELQVNDYIKPESKQKKNRYKYLVKRTPIFGPVRIEIAYSDRPYTKQAEKIVAIVPWLLHLVRSPVILRLLSF